MLPKDLMDFSLGGEKDREFWTSFVFFFVLKEPWCLVC